jgi:septation ring formation regulator EzrA
MEAMAQEWTDGRIDELSSKVDRGFDRVDHRFTQVDLRFEQVDKRFEQVDQRFTQVDKRFEKVETDIRDLRVEMKTGFAALDGRLDSLQRVMIQAIIALTAAILAGFVGICGVLVATL